MTAPHYQDDTVTVHAGDCLDVLRELPDNSVDAVVTDPPYSLNFMGKSWDEHAGREDAALGYWLAGFIDGEGCFTVKGHTRGTYAPSFTLKVRRDDRAALQQAQRFVGAGQVEDVTDSSGNSHPQSRWAIQDREGCQRLVDVLDKYPLRAKKRIDYVTWREAVCEWTDRPRGNRWTGAADQTRMVALRERTSAVKGYVDPPWSGNEFQDWCRLWSTECLRVLKPGGYLLAFGGTRTWHRLAVAVEDAGFEMRDSLAWLYGQGFPKSMNVSGDRRFCQCEPVPYNHDRDDVRGVREAFLDVPPNAQAGEVSDVLTTVQRRSAGPGVGEARSGSTEGARPVCSALRSGEFGMERRGNAQASEGELQGREVRAVSTGVVSHGDAERVHRGAPAGHGAVGGPSPDAAGNGQPYRPRPVEQRPVEPRAVPDERGSQARGVWPICERCAQPMVPDGLGTALKPAFEPVAVARKPLVGTVAGNVLTHGTGALNIDGCRIESDEDTRRNAAGGDNGLTGSGTFKIRERRAEDQPKRSGRWPANVVLDESQAEALDQQSGASRSRVGKPRGAESGDGWGMTATGAEYDDQGGASRFFYTAKADSGERITHDGVAHPTVKPLTLMRWLVRLVTPPGGTVLEPFAGSGTTVEACILEGLRCIAIEREPDYLPLIVQRINRRRDPVAYITATGEDLGLFG